jgi:transcriptional regulator with XRE-family HTH domain
MKVGTRIKQLREAKGFSQQVVADHLGMTQANHHKLESDKTHVRLEYLEKLADFYKVSLTELIDLRNSVVHIENNTHNHNGVVLGDLEALQQVLAVKDELIKLKDEKIAWLEEKIKLLTE